jgi:hypothetical protein
MPAWLLCHPTMESWLRTNHNNEGGCKPASSCVCMLCIALAGGIFNVNCIYAATHKNLPMDCMGIVLEVIRRCASPVGCLCHCPC